MRLSGSVVFSLCLLSGNTAAAATIPVGVLNDIAYNTVVNDWGWTLAYRGGGDERASVEDLFGTVRPGDYLMFASLQDGSATFDVLAAALATDVMTFTAQDITHEANGALWYFNAVSMGFAGLGDTIFQSDIDVRGGEERDRLSWTACAFSAPECNLGHDVSLIEPVVGIGTSSRSGTEYDASAGWDRLVLVSHRDPIDVPEPSVFFLLAVGCVRLGIRRLRVQ